MKKLIKNLKFKIIISTLLVAGASFYFLTKPAIASWFDENWLYRKAINIATHTAAENNVYIQLSSAKLNQLDTSDTTRFQSNCGDLRFTDFNGKLLPYYIVSGCGTNNTTVHVFFSSFPAGAQTIYVYYGNPSANYGSQGADFSTEATNYTFRSSSIDSGTGADGACSVSADTNINTASCAGRGTADAVNFSSTANTSAGATSIVLTATSTGLTTGDEVLIINLQGTSGDNSNVGKYETKTISSITTTSVSNDTLNFATGLTNAYDGTTQKIMVQRVPNYTTVTVDANKTMNVSAWNGTKGGVLFFRANGTVTVNGTIDVRAMGYRGGATGGSCDSNDYQGESYLGLGAINNRSANGGGGGGGTSLQYRDSGGGGGYGTAGGSAWSVSTGYCPNGPGCGGNTYGVNNLSTLFLGSGGGGAACTYGAGEPGSGLIMIFTSNLVANGGITANGNNSNTTGGGVGAGGASSGGSVYLACTDCTLGTNKVTASGGTGIYTQSNNERSGDGGVGRIALTYNNSVSGTTNPSANVTTVNGAFGSEEQGPGPVAYWRFDEGQGTTAYNSMQPATTNNVVKGTGTDGACSVSADTNINTASCAERGTADAVNFSSTANTSAGATAIVLTATSTGLAVGDEVLIINLKGTSSDYSNTGKYETKTISSITTTSVSNDTLNFAAGLTNTYDGTTQKIMAQRVPNYSSVTVNGTYTLTASAWNGTKGGVLFLKATGTVTINGTVSMSSNGYIGGAIMSNGGGCEPDSDGQGYGGETYNGYAFRGSGVETPNQTGGAGGGQNATWDVKSTTGNTGGGGGGGGWWFGWAGGYGGGGGYGTVGQGLNPGNGTLGGNTTSGNKAASGGGTYGSADLASQIMFGSGGGGGDVSGGQGPCPGGVGTTFGGYGGGIITINGNTITVNGGGLIKANGQNTTWGGGGAGGSVKLAASTLTLGTNLVTATGGTSNGYAGGSGRITINDNTISGTTNPTYYNATPTTNGSLSGSTLPTWQTEDQCISGKCLYFDGSTSNITVANAINGIKTISFWVRPTTTASTALIDFDGGTHKITTDSSSVISATGFTSPAYYINGVQKTSPVLTANTWQYVEITTGTSFNSTSSLTIGKSSSTYLKGFLDEVKIYPYARTAAQIKTDYLAGKANAGTKQGDAAVLGGKPEDWLSNGLVGYWKMDETATPSIDSSGNGLSGTWTGGATYGTGQFGNGISLNGSGRYVSVANNAVLNTTSGTIAAWVKVANLPASAWYTVAAKWVNDPYGYRLIIGTSGQVQFTIGDGSGADGTNSANNVVAAGTWVHLVGTWKAGAGVTLYVNGAYSAGPTGTRTISYSGSPSTLKIGRNVAEWDLNGVIDDVRIYNRVLSPKEVSDLYNFAPGPVGYWNFEEGTGTAVNDTSGSGNAGTWNGSGSHWTTGKYGKAGNFNSTTTDYVGIGDVLDSTSAMSWSAWYKATATGTAKTIMFKRVGTSEYAQYAITTNASTIYCLQSADGTTWGTLVSATEPSANVWHHIECTNDNTTARMFIDGVQIATDTSPATSLAASTAALNIGFGRAANADAYHTGQIDDAKIYSYARTAKQIVSDMNAGHPAVGSPVGSAVGYWKFDEGTDNKCKGGTNDVCNSGSGGSALDGAETGMAVPATSTSGWTNSGKFSKALLFDGSNDVVNTPETSALTIGKNDFTASIWVKFTSTAFSTVMAWRNESAGCNFTETKVQGLFTINRATTDGTVWFETWAWQTTSTRVSSGIALNDNNWHHVAAVYTASNNTLKLYADGVLRDSKDQSTTSPSTNNNFKVLLGSNICNAQYFPGSVDELKVYNYALTADEVKIEYNRGSSLVLGAAGTNSSYQPQAANQEYCIPGDTTSCASPVGEWKFEEGSGTSVNDTSGNGNTGTATGTSVKPGKIGKARQFSTSSDIISTSSVVSTATNNFTIEAWVYWKGDTGNHQIIVYNGNSGTSGWGMYLDYTDSNQIHLLYGGVISVDTNTAIAANRWNHIVMKRDSGTLYGFLNGSQFYSGNTQAPNTPGTATYIGNNASSQYFNGSIDQVRIFNYARTAAQIAWDYNRGKPVGHWKMDECQGTVANDSSGNGNTGTITIGGTGTQTAVGTCSTSGTAWGNGVSGKRNYSLNFDGTNDYVSVPDTSALRPGTSDFSTAFWFKAANSNQSGALMAKRIPSDPYNQWQVTTGTVNWLGAMAVSKKLSFILIQNGITNWVSYVTTNDVIDGNWHHVVAIRVGVSDAISVYIDGNNAPLTLVASNGSIPHNINNTQPWTIGSDNGSSYFNGQIDDARVYNYALTATQVKDIVNEGAVRFGPSTGAP